MSKFKVGDVYESNRYGAYEIIEKMPDQRYRIRFQKTNYEKVVAYATLHGGNVRDPYYPIYYGVACVGLASTEGNGKKFGIWRAMIARCYDKKHKCYNSYGGNGVSVCERWLCFEHFLEDFESISGFNRELFDKNMIVLDKDIKYKGFQEKQYSIQNCSFVSQVDNFQEMLTRRKRTTSSRYIGVSALKGGKWQASISYRRKNIYIGRFETEADAHKAYLAKRRELYGAEINVIGE